MSEHGYGPVVVIVGKAQWRRMPAIGVNRVTDADGEYPVGLWVSWCGRQVAVCRGRWWVRRATWRNRATCLWRGEHVPVRVITDAELLGATPDTAEVRVVADRIDCAHCGVTLRGPEWVSR